MTAVRIGINGFGRIGRAAFKWALDGGDVEVVGINDLADTGDLAYMLKFDSVYGRFGRPVDVQGDDIMVVDGRRIPFFTERDPGAIPWKDVGADLVIESTGAFRGRDEAAAHLEAGAKRVIISAPSDDADGTFVPGANDETYDPERHRVISLASCTTNCVAPVLKVLDEAFGVEYCMLTTVHAYTSSQSLVDTPSRKRRRGRAAALSIIPTTTGAAKATERVLPRLAGRLDGLAMRVPVPDGSISDLVAELGTETSAQEVNDVLRAAAGNPALEKVLAVTDEELVSADVIGDPHSAIVDAPSTRVMRERVAKVLAWYDNEAGYAARLIDFAVLMADRGLD